MRSFLRNGIRAQIWELKRLDRDRARDGGPPSPVEFLARLGVLILVALCFGLAAQLLVGAR